MFAVEFTVGEKRGLESKTNKCVLYCRRSEKFPMVGIQLGMPAGHACFPKCPGESVWAGLLPFQQGASGLSSGLSPCCPLCQHTLPTAPLAQLKLLPSPTLKCTATDF